MQISFAFRSAMSNFLFFLIPFFPFIIMETDRDRERNWDRETNLGTEKGKDKSLRKEKTQDGKKKTAQKKTRRVEGL